MEQVQLLWAGECPYMRYRDPKDAALVPRMATDALSLDRIIGVSKKTLHSVIVDDKGLFLVETTGDLKKVRKDDALLRAIVRADKVPPGNPKFGLIHAGRHAERGLTGSIKDATSVIPMTLVAPTMRSGCLSEENCIRYYELPHDYVGGDLLAAIPDGPGGLLSFAAVNGKEVSRSVEGNPKRFAISSDGSLIEGVSDWHGSPIVPWTHSDPEVVAAKSNGGPGPVIVPVDCFADIAIHATFAKPGWQLQPFNDGSLVEARDGKLWCSSTDDPATHVWVPILTITGAT